MRISLISPKWDKMVLTYPPLGLAYLAATLENSGHQVRIHVFSLSPQSSVEDNVREVREFCPDIVGITAMTNAYHGAIELADQIKASIGCPIVLGGPHPTVLPERTAAEPSVDYVVCGEGEATLAELVERLEHHGHLEEVQGLCFKRDGAIVRTKERALIDDLDSLPFPARHLLDLARFPLRSKSGQPMTTVITSRGCPYDCSYCFKGIFGRKYRQRSPQNVIAELRTVLQDSGIRNFYFIDDLFTASVKWLSEFTQQLIQEGLDIRWQCLARVDRVNPGLLQRMRQAGCREIHYGIESGNQGILSLVSKHIALEDVERAVRWTKEAGMMTKGYFMIGLPGDTARTTEETMRLACQLELDEAMFSLTTPFPGTRLWQTLFESRPDIEFDEAFVRAYYFGLNGDETKPFLNVSSMSDRKLMAAALAAPKRFEEHRKKQRYMALCGKRIGLLLWCLSRIGPLRVIGRMLRKWPRFKRLSGGSSDMARLWT